MKKKLSTLIICFLILFFGIIFGVFLRQNKTTWAFIKKPFIESYLKSDATKKVEWSNDFEIVKIKSNLDNNIQKAYFYKSKSDKPCPLIVSLHTWSGDYKQIDFLSELCKSKGLNYIHPDFRGANITKDACCSELALNDIDESISFAINNAKVDTSKIFVIGVSGGGYAAICTFMKSNQRIKKFSAWVPITDLIAWFKESTIRQNHYAENILNCTESINGSLNENLAKQKSPIYWKTPVNKLSYSEIKLYTGVFDGIQGSVPITHSINFYNKILSDLSVTDSSKYVSDKEKLQLLEYRKQLGDFGMIADRHICLIKEFKNIKLIVFEGNHEMLSEYALNELIAN
jgi:hypothetical protein